MTCEDSGLNFVHIYTIKEHCMHVATHFYLNIVLSYILKSMICALSLVLNISLSYTDIYTYTDTYHNYPKYWYTLHSYPDIFSLERWMDA